jgi:Na+/H+ antiporter NhaD/arsenite permease-like protein
MPRQDRSSRCWPPCPLGWVMAAALLCLGSAAPWAAAAAAPAGPRLEVVGAILDGRGRGLAGVQLQLEAAGQPLLPESRHPLLSDRQGRFQAICRLPAGSPPPGRLVVRASKPSWQTAAVSFPVHPADAAAPSPLAYQAMGRLTLSRQATPALGVAGIILVGVLGLMAAGRLHPALAASLGAALMLFLSYTLGQASADFFIISFEEAVAAIDLNAVLLLVGLMLYVGVLKKTGLFPWLAFLAYAGGRGRIVRVVLLFMGWTALMSAFLDNVTTVAAMAPLGLALARTLGSSPASFLVPMALAAGLGGTATLIGDPANIVIGSAANLTFGAFAASLAPIMILCLAAAAGFFLLWYRRDYAQARRPTAADLTVWQPEGEPLDRPLLSRCLIVLALMVLFFCLQGRLGLKPSVTALLGAVLLIAVSRLHIADLLSREIQWPLLLVLMAVAIVAAGAVETGLFDYLARAVEHLVQGQRTPAILLVLWGGAALAALVGPIPAAVTLLPLVASLHESVSDAASGVLWWALALGVGLGGTGTAPLDPTLLWGRDGQAWLWPILISLLLGSVYLLAVF